LTATVTDTNGNSITGLALSYTSTTPQTIGVSSTGSITSTFPSSGAIYAVCQPTTCNPSPINQLGVNGNGTAIVSNSVKVTSPGNGSNFLWLASPLSPYFVAVDLTTGTTGTPVKLPYTPNSMVIDQTGSTLYFGNYRELMIYNASTNALTTEDTSVPGVVLAVSPTNSQILINDQDRQVFYLYAPGTTGVGKAAGTPATIQSSFGGVGQRAAYSPDGNTVYIVGNNTLYVHNNFTGWSVEQLSGNSANPTATCPANLGPLASPSTDQNIKYNAFCAPDLSLAVPAVGTFLSGTSATARGFCPDTTGVNVDNYPSAVPGGATGYAFGADHLAATNDGTHVIGATANPPTLTDATMTTPTGACPTIPVTAPDGTVTSKSVGLQIPNTANNPQPLPATAGIQNIDQVVVSPDSSIAFVTYYSSATTTPAGGAQLPVYKIPATGPGTLSSVPLSGSAIAPVAGIFSPDYQTFFVSTTGDNLVHLISTPTLTDTQQLNPKLPDASGNPTPAQLLAVKPRATN
jgi:sugar lactone lactonase YvrE